MFRILSENKNVSARRDATTQTDTEYEPTLVEKNNEILEQALDEVALDEQRKMQDVKEADRERACKERLELLRETECRFKNPIYVLSKNGAPLHYYDKKCKAVKTMREMARKMCLNYIGGLFDPHTYLAVKHETDDCVDVVRFLNNTLIRYDETVCKFRVFQVFKM